MKFRTTTRTGFGVSLLIVILTVVLGIFPITVFLGVMAFVDGVREYWRTPDRPLPTQPANWDVVDRGHIPATTQDAVKHARQRLAESCEAHGKHVPRMGALGAT
jgi:hypothetical protein